jgi:acetyl-CoA acetyltransferase
MSSFKDEYAITGIGQTKVGQVPGHSKREFAVEAARRAIEDSGLERDDIEATIRVERSGGGGGRPDYADEFCRILGIPAKAHFQVGRGGEMASLAVMAGTQLINLGVTDHVLVSYGCDDWSRSHQEEQRDVATMESKGKDGLWGKEFGDIRAPNHHAFLASRHMHEYGTTSEDLGRIAVAQREWAQRNPDAYMSDRPITLEDHQDSPLVVEPYHLLDCCLQSDGGAAFIISSSDTTDDVEPDPVYVKGIGFGEHIREYWWNDLNYTRLAVDTAKETAFDTADITLDDVDFAQLYDCFTGEVLFQIEDYGWAEKGKAKEFLRDDRLGPDGDVPINTGGGLLSSHHHGNMTGMMEALYQLRGEAGDRQVDDAETGIVSGHGGEILRPGMASHHSTLVLGQHRD